MVSLDVGVFDGLTNLARLSLYGNELISLPDGVFEDLTNLQYLVLGSNDLVSLDVGVFDGLTNLETLRFHDNNLSSLPDGVFEDLTNLEDLYFDNNPLVCIPLSAFGSRTDVSGISINPALCSTQCSSQVNTPCGQSNQLPCCPDSGLVCVNGACAVPVSGFNICDRTSQVQAEIIRQLSSSSPGITCTQVTSAQLRTITRLDLRSKSIKALKSGDFDNLTNLEHLNLGRNELASLPPDVF